MAAAVAVAIALTACGSDASSDGSSDGGGAVALAGSWRAVAGTVEGEQVDLLAGWDVTLDVDGRRIAGTAACNGYGGRADIGDGTISIAELSWTEMGCEPSVMELEQAYLLSLGTIDSWSIEGDRLTLTGPASTWTFEAAPVPRS